MEDATKNIFDTWYKNTSNLMNGWLEASEKMKGEQIKAWEEAAKMQQKWMDSYQSMMRDMQVPFMSGGNGSNPFSAKTMQDAFTNMLNSTDIYTRLLQLWRPVFEAMQNNRFDPQDLWKMVDQSAFKELISKLFAFDSISEGSWMQQPMQMMKWWRIDSRPLMGWYMELARSTYGSLPGFQPVKEFTEEWSQLMEKADRLQAMLYDRGIAATEKLMQEMAARMKEGKMPADFTEFFNEWSATNEKEFVSLFNTDEYASLQADLLKLNSTMSSHYQKLMESFLTPFPVVPKSQLEDVYRTNHELRGRINTLERIVAELQDTIKRTAEASTKGGQNAEQSSGQKNKR